MHVNVINSEHFICAFPFVIRSFHCNSFVSSQCLSFIYINNCSTDAVASALPPDCAGSVSNEATSDAINLIINPHNPQETCKLDLTPTSVAASK